MKKPRLAGFGDLRHASIVALVVVLTGCGTTDKLHKQSSMELCMNYLTLPSFNIWQSDRAAELAQRGEDCSRYAPAASVQQQNDQRVLNVLDAAARAAQPPPRPAAPIVCRTQGGWTTCQ